MIPPLSRTRTYGIQVTISTEVKKDHAAQRGRDAFGTATRISASLSRRLSAFFRSVSDQDPKAAKFAVLNPGRPAFQQHVERTEGSDTTHASHTRKTMSAGCTNPDFDKSEKITRPSGAATPRNSDAHKRIAVPQAFCVLRERTRPRPKSGKVCRSDTRPRRVSEPCETLRG